MHIHSFRVSDKKGYEVCSCGTYHSTRLAKPETLYEDDYWSHEKGHSTFDEQIFNVSLDYVDGFSKVNKVLYSLGGPGSLLEIGCAPGVLLNKAVRMGFDAWGIEPDKRVIEEIVTAAPKIENKVIQGYFPNVILPKTEFKYVAALDVLEHIEDYESFVSDIWEIMEDGGKCLFMLPLIVDGEYRERDFDIPDEHAWLFSMDYIKEFMESIFREVKFDRWREGHDIILVTK